MDDAGSHGFEIHRTVRALRHVWGKTIADAAEVLGHDAAELSRIENGKRKISVRFAQSLDTHCAQTVGLSREWQEAFSAYIWNRQPTWFRPWDAKQAQLDLDQCGDLYNDGKLDQALALGARLYFEALHAPPTYLGVRAGHQLAHFFMAQNDLDRSKGIAVEAGDFARQIELPKKSPAGEAQTEDGVSLRAYGVAWALLRKATCNRLKSGTDPMDAWADFQKVETFLKVYSLDNLKENDRESATLLNALYRERLSTLVDHQIYIEKFKVVSPEHSRLAKQCRKRLRETIDYLGNSSRYIRSLYVDMQASLWFADEREERLGKTHEEGRKGRAERLLERLKLFDTPRAIPAKISYLHTVTLLLTEAGFYVDGLEQAMLGRKIAEESGFYLMKEKLLLIERFLKDRIAAS